MKEIALKAMQYGANQDVKELTELLNYLPSGQKIVVEIGVEYGGTFYCWSRIADKKATLIGIDWEVEPCSVAWADRHNPQLDELKKICLQTQKIHLIKGRSQDEITYDKFKDVLKDRFIDLLHIDGEHSYEGCKRDFELYSPHVRSGGLVIFHDVVGKQPGFAVYKFFDELKGKKKIISLTPNWRGFGIWKKE